jgi:hypothetical protein
MKRNSLLLAIVLCAMTALASSQPALGSPAASTTIVISQVYGGGGGSTGTYLNDYVELKNISATQQSLAGLSLQYGSAVGNFGSSASNIFALPAVTLNPGQYYLVQLSAAGTAGAPLPVTPDSTTTNLSMAAGSGKVALAVGTASLACGATATPCVFPNANIVDWVAYGAAGNGTAGNGEGGTSVNNNTALTSSQGGVRKAAGCTDTDNNNLDFDVVTAPVPRNSSSTATACSGGPVAPVQHVLDFNGDGRTDFSVVRNVGGGANGQAVWYNLLSGTATSGAVSWGLASDFFVPADYDGDSKTDLSIWRPGASGSAAWYTLLSSDSTVRFENFGQTGDDPTVVGDYDGDGKDDIAVYREGTVAAPQSTWYFRTVANGPVVFVPWGQANDFPAPGDYDGDGKNDFSVQRDGGGGQAVFITRLTTGPTTYTAFGNPSDGIAPGDYDGDGKTDFAVFRDQGGVLVWYYLPSSGGSYVTTVFGSSAVDKVVQGDYDGDGRTDQAVWRTTTGQFWVNNSSAAGVQVTNWGSPGDYPTANSYTH